MMMKQIQIQKLKNNLNVILPLLFAAIFLTGCAEDYTPKPRGFFRIELPEHTYTSFAPDSSPFSFEYPEYAVIEPVRMEKAEPFWYNINFPTFNGQINLSYKTINGDLNQFLEDSRTLAYQHTVKASAINEILIQTDNPRVHGILYELQGNTASPLQFYITDSTKHFLRGSLYFNVLPQSDSLAPVIEHTREDILHLIKTLNWN